MALDLMMIVGTRGVSNSVECSKTLCVVPPVTSKESVGAVCFVSERARAPRHFLLGKGHPMMKL